MAKQSETKLHALDYWQVARNRYAVILLTFALVFMTALVIAYLRPSEYLGRVQIQVQREARDIEVFRETGSVGNLGSDQLPYMTFMQTQFEIIQSRETLKEVIKNGISDAFVVAYYNGKRISLRKAKEVISSKGEKIIETTTSLGNQKQGTPTKDKIKDIDS